MVKIRMLPRYQKGDDYPIVQKKKIQSQLRRLKAIPNLSHTQTNTNIRPSSKLELFLKKDELKPLNATLMEGLLNDTKNDTKYDTSSSTIVPNNILKSKVVEDIPLAFGKGKFKADLLAIFKDLGPRPTPCNKHFGINNNDTRGRRIGQSYLTVQWKNKDFHTIRRSFEVAISLAWLTHRTFVMPPPAQWYGVDCNQYAKPSRLIRSPFTTEESSATANDSGRSRASGCSIYDIYDEASLRSEYAIIDAATFFEKDITYEEFQRITRIKLKKQKMDPVIFDFQTGLFPSKVGTLEVLLHKGIKHEQLFIVPEHIDISASLDAYFAYQPTLLRDIQKKNFYGLKIKSSILQESVQIIKQLPHMKYAFFGNYCVLNIEPQGTQRFSQRIITESHLHKKIIRLCDVNEPIVLMLPIGGFDTHEEYYNGMMESLQRKFKKVTIFKLPESIGIPDMMVHNLLPTGAQQYVISKWGRDTSYVNSLRQQLKQLGADVDSKIYFMFPYFEDSISIRRLNNNWKNKQPSYMSNNMMRYNYVSREPSECMTVPPHRAVKESMKPKGLNLNLTKLFPDVDVDRFKQVPIQIGVEQLATKYDYFLELARYLDRKIRNKKDDSRNNRNNKNDNRKNKRNYNNVNDILKEDDKNNSMMNEVINSEAKYEALQDEQSTKKKPKEQRNYNLPPPPPGATTPPPRAHTKATPPPAQRSRTTAPPKAQVRTTTQAPPVQNDRGPPLPQQAKAPRGPPVPPQAKAPRGPPIPPQAQAPRGPPIPPPEKNVVPQKKSNTAQKSQSVSSDTGKLKGPPLPSITNSSAMRITSDSTEISESDDEYEELDPLGATV